jgi:hypothetical protein
MGGYSQALMNVYNYVQNPIEAEGPSFAKNILTLIQLAPEKLTQMATSMERNLLNGQDNRLLVNFFYFPKSSSFFFLQLLLREYLENLSNNSLSQISLNPCQI